MILHAYLAEVPLVLNNLLERLTDTDLSLFGVLAGCLIVFRISTLRKKPDETRRPRPPGPNDAEPARERVRVRDPRD